jgi:hypothetical protein
VQRGCQLFLHTERPLRSGPDSQFPLSPFSDGGAWLKGSMRNVRDGVGLLQTLRGCGEAIRDGAFFACLRALAVALKIFLQVRVEFFA